MFFSKLGHKGRLGSSRATGAGKHLGGNVALHFISAAMEGVKLKVKAGFFNNCS